MAMDMKTLAFGTLCFSSISLFAQPQNPQVVEGRAEFFSKDRDFTIQAEDRSIIHWDSFSIAKEEKTHFSLPHETSCVLNRVTGGDMSEIYGRLSSNGGIYLINPYGILIGKEGLIQVGNFLGSTLDMANTDFLTGKEIHFSGDSKEAIENQGTILAQSGDVVFLSHSIDNSGTIEALQGLIVMGAGEEMLYLPYGDARIQISVKPAVKNGDEPIGILQTGTLTALSHEFAADGNLYSYAIKNDGYVKATGLETKEGRICFVAEDGVARHNGELIADRVELLGEHIRVGQQATIDASRPNHGGVILIGGDYQGKNPAILNANTTLVEKGASLKADALENGDGGKIIIWSNGATGFYGSASVNAGAKGGNGGLVEVSGLSELDFDGKVDAEALFGQRGTLLLDPSNTVISTGGQANVTFTACPTGTYVPTANSAVINTTTLTGAAQLGTCNISITTSGAGTQAGTLTVSNPINWTSNNSLTISSDSTMTINADITNTSTSANLTLISGMTTSSAMTIAAGVTVRLTSGGILTLNANTVATSDITINGTVTAVGSDLTILLADDFVLSSTGAINFNSPGKTFSLTTTVATNSVVNLSAGTVTVTDGNVNVSSVGTLSLGNISLSGTGTGSFTSTGTLTTTALTSITHNSTGPLSISTAGGTGALTMGGMFTQAAAAGNVSLGSAAALNINDGFSVLGGSSTTTIIGTGTATFGAASNFSYLSSGDLLIRSTTSDITISGMFNATSANVTFNPFDDLTLTANTGILTYSAVGKTLSFETGPSTTYNFNGSMSVTGGNLNITAFDDIIIGSAGSILYDVVGGSAIFTSIGGIDPDFTITGALRINNGTITANTFDDIILSAITGSITYNSPETSLFAATGSDGDITLSGTLTVTNGSLNFICTDNFTTAATCLIDWTSPGTMSVLTNGSNPLDSSDISLSETSNFTNGQLILHAADNLNRTGTNVYNYSAPRDLIMISDRANMSLAGVGNLNTAAACVMTAPGNINILQLLRNNSTGPINITCAGTCTVGAVGNTAAAQIGSASGATTLNVGSLAVIASQTTANVDATLGFGSGNIVLNVSREFVVTGANINHAEISTLGTIQGTIGGDLNLTLDPLSTTTGESIISAGKGINLTARNMYLGQGDFGGQIRIQTFGNDITLVSMNNAFFEDYSRISNLGSGNITIVVDQQAPFPPQVGTGGFIFTPKADILTAGSQIRFFTAAPSQNAFLGTVNGHRFSAGGQVFGVYYSTFTGDNLGVPFTIYYKIGSETATSSFNQTVSQMVQQYFDWFMGFAWEAPYNVCSLDKKAQERMVYQRRPFRYPIYLPHICCPEQSASSCFLPNSDHYIPFD